MTIKRIRFADLNIGSEFILAKRILTKMKINEAVDKRNHQLFLFNSSDMVSVESPDQTQSFPVFGLSGKNNQGYLGSDDEDDEDYSYYGDKCN